MSRYFTTIHSEADRARTLRIVSAAPLGSRVEVKAARRTLPQNSLLWALLTDVATQLPWHGQKLRPDDWKLLFLDALKREEHLVPNLEGTGLVNISGTSSSDLSKEEMGGLIDLIGEFGARHGVKFNEPRAA